MMNPKMNNVLCGVVLLVLSAALVVPPVLILMNKNMKLGGGHSDSSFDLMPNPFEKQKAGTWSVLDYGSADGKLASCVMKADGTLGSCLMFADSDAEDRVKKVVEVAYLETMLSLSIGCLLFVFAVVCFVKAAGK